MVDSNRIVSFDILKGGGILLVILGHIQIPYMLKTVIYYVTCQEQVCQGFQSGW